MKNTLLATLVAALLATPSQARALAPIPFDADAAAFAHIHIAAAGDAQGEAEHWRQWGEDLAAEMRTSMGTMFSARVGSSRVVKGAPYSAEVITEINQTLGDGNVISKKTTGAVYRDTEGRTRQESGPTGKESIFISDPVEGKQIVLVPGTRHAIVIPRAFSTTTTKEKPDKDKVVKEKRKEVVILDGTEVSIENGKVFLDGKEVPDGNLEVNTARGATVRVENGKVTLNGQQMTFPAPPKVAKIVRTESGDGTTREEVRVQVIRAGDGGDFALAPLPPTPPVPPIAGAPLGAVQPPLAPLPPMPGLQGLRFEGIGKLGKGTTTGLGTKEFDGVKAEGKSTVWTIPAGQIGNRNPINITSESWYAPDLQVTVSSRYNDPRTGESIYRLAGIRRAEPAASLFRTPEGYDVRDKAKAVEERREQLREQREQRQGERKKAG